MNEVFDADLTAGMTRDLERLNRLGDQFARTMSRSFQDLAFRGKGFGDVLRDLGQQLAKLALQSALKPLGTALGAAFGNLFAGQFANGAAFQAGAIMPFASGGVIAEPAFFQMAAGRIGLMGENGAEAIMPLARGADGRLGVRASGAGGAGANITVNISTPDVEGFRRSQTQVAALLSRTVSQGQRNL
ncbi:MAG: phage tail tape measure protein [Alphaproteobacteria bacterium]|nr:phage tail tape measure protein [Alphaproteobacteria bacterium]